MNKRLALKTKKSQISNSIEIVDKIQIGNVDAFEIVRFKEHEDLSEDHSLKFIKLIPDEIPDEKIFQKIFEDLPKPKFIIFINGDLQEIDYPLKQYEKEFKETLSNFLIADTQWVIGTGVNIGIHRLISEAVQDCRFDNFEKEVNMIGMLDFANIAGHQSVIKTETNSRRKSNLKESNFQLDPHYNCLILHEITDSSKFEKHLEIQIKLHEYCRKYDAFTIQILCGGQLYELESSIESLKGKTYVLVLKGSGGIAEVICNLIKPSININEESIMENVNKYLEDITDKEMEDYKNILPEISKFKNQILIYDIMNKTERIDKQLFEAIVASMDGNLEKILLLSMPFSEKFISKRNIFQHSDFNTLNDQQKRNIFKAILKNNKPILFELFLVKVVSIDKFLNVADLKYLYQESIRAKIGCKKLLIEEFSLIEKTVIFKGSKDCLDSNDQEKAFTFGRERLKTKSDVEANETKYATINASNVKEKAVKFEVDNSRSKESSQLILMENMTYNEINENLVECQHLFVWALLSGLHEIAKIIWRVGTDHVATALKGSIILKKMSRCVIDLSQLSKNYSKESELYENMAINIMTEAFIKNQWKAHFILLRPLERWNNNSCLQIAVHGDVKAFCNQNACLSYTKRAWNGNYSLLVSTKNRFQNNNDENMKRWEKLKQKVTKYYRSPKIKFINYIISYFIFLLFFIHVNLVEFKPLANYDGKINMWSEIYVYCYVLGFIVEEINQIINEESKDIKSRFIAYKNGSWNKYDCLIIFLFIISAILRFTLSDTNFDIIRCLYALTLSLFFIRSMQFFFINRSLGPKVIMIEEMIIDILFFLLIFCIFIVSYGTLSQSLQHPNSPLQFSLINDILYRPYFHVYGELMLEDYKTPCNSTNCLVVEQTRIIAFGIFLLLTTILLVNLLVAMFGHTFTLIQKDVENHFSFLQLQLLQEFYNKLFFPPPFNIVVYIVMIFHYKIFDKNKKSSRIILVDNSRCDSSRLAVFELSFVESTFQKFKPKQIL